MQRQIVLDTETTGLSAQAGHRLIEIGCIELVNRYRTQNDFHVYINPERDIDEGAIAVHGITRAFLDDKPLFSDIADKLLAYLKGAELIIHNAAFDMGFLNSEFKRLKRGIKSLEMYCTVFDTLLFARKKHIAQHNNLDALCKRYNVDNSKRTLHGALRDADLLADVFLAMTRSQATLFSDEPAASNSPANAVVTPQGPKTYRIKLQKASDKEAALHQAFLERLASSKQA